MTILKTRASYLLSGMMLMFFAFSPLSGSAQQPVPQQQQQQPQEVNYSDEELETFVSVTKDIIDVQEGYQDDMEEAVKEEGLTTEEFQAMAQSRQTGQEVEMSEEKKSAFANAMQTVMGIQQEMNQEMQETIEESDMDIQAYQQMSMQIQQDPELSAKVEQMLQN